MSWDFDGDCIESVACFQQYGHFCYINLANPWACEIFPSSEVFFDFFLQRLDVLVIQIFHLLDWSHSKLFYITFGYCKKFDFPNLFLSHFMFSITKGSWILWSNFVSSHFAEGTYQLSEFSGRILRSLMYIIPSSTNYNTLNFSF